MNEGNQVPIIDDPIENQLTLKTSRELSIIVKESMEYT